MFALSIVVTASATFHTNTLAQAQVDLLTGSTIAVISHIAIADILPGRDMGASCIDVTAMRTLLTIIDLLTINSIPQIAFIARAIAGMYAYRCARRTLVAATMIFFTFVDFCASKTMTGVVLVACA